jgi:tetratricopeptide (TPR) repeat protein
VALLRGLGRAHRSLGKFDEAVDLHLKSLKAAQKLGDASLEAASYMGLANAYKSLGRYAEALEMLEKAQIIAKGRGIELNPMHIKQWTDSAAASLVEILKSQLPCKLTI